MKTTLISFNPHLYTSMGHNLTYVRCLGNAAYRNEWDFLSLLPRKNILEDLAENWLKTLHCPTVRHCFETVEKRPYRRPKKIIRAGQRCAYFFSAFLSLHPFVKKSNDQTILFLESFTPYDLSLLVSSLYFLPKKNLSVALVHRYPSFFWKEEIRTIDRLQKKLLSQGISLHLFTDSERLKQNLEPFFQRSLTVLPIPHTEYETFEKEKKEKIVCWWPGGYREGKGLSFIRQFITSKNPYASCFQLFLNEKAPVPEGNMKITRLPDYLPREEYLCRMRQSDMLLLPYSDPYYEMSTSGIFVEGIAAGKIPVVFPNTWMAYELKKHDLEELILQPTDTAEKLYALHGRTDTREKLMNMRESYRSFHSPETYAAILKETFHGS